ncbi:predicted protein [Sclerotinia sclerotiorum 1980 UF-70]|uniref:Uncharacterized protein n=1 Tax=Sclerotinia sclerotiorum (strain ATCC 18683 / 1980 / Ss-1) TaxID=665079 RepID=A7EEV7_SCLS1|nr:predicted protein [Sclerotinia sclerotiorum 1980 UF-70]EDO01373.1 predicted protein [Sclerotinia sclerotiorum 1980 UF-70]
MHLIYPSSTIKYPKDTLRTCWDERENGSETGHKASVSKRCDAKNVDGIR